MKNSGIAVLASFTLVLALGSFSRAASPPAGNILPDLVEKVMPGVVNISTTYVQRVIVPGWDDFFGFWGIPQEQRRVGSSLGSGFIIDEKDGYVLTNNHVVEHASAVTVTLFDKRQFKAKTLVSDPKMDLALLQIRDKSGHVPQNLKSVNLSDSDKVRIGESVFAVGNPFGLQHTVTVGIISAKNRTVGMGPLDNYLQTDASINPGNSGGPLFDLKGEVIGINTMIFSETHQNIGLGFAIPSLEALRVLSDFKRYGHVIRPWLGILGQPLNPQIAEHYELGTDRGVLVYNLVKGRPAHSAGLKRGDIITSIDGIAVQDPADLERVLAKHRPLETVTLKIVRGMKKAEVKVQ
ncbi:MAG: trypsin-like peptidase domain-containing protein, partial [Bdellovibrionota bacterium]